MSTLAKTFVVINLVLSTVFLTMTMSLYQHSTDWRQKFDDLANRYRGSVRYYESALKAKNEQINKKTESESSLLKENQLLRSHLDGLGDRLVAVTAQLNQKMSEFDRLLSDHAKVVEQLEQRQTRITVLERERDTARQERQQAITDKTDAETQVARLLSIKNSLEKDMTEIRKDFVKTRQDLADKELILTHLQAKGVNISDYVAGTLPQPIPATVLAVLDEVQPPLVLLSVGQNEGVKVGYEFTVYRHERFVARVVVEKVLPNKSGARVIFPVEAQIFAGDSANTVLQ